MPSPIDLSGISGLDGVIPVYDPYSSWRLWSKNDIFTGSVGQDRYVPKVNDWVVDTDTSIYYRVTQIDPTTGLSTLVQIVAVANGVTNELDRMVIPGSDTYFAYLDKNVTPYRLTLDQRAIIPGSMSSFCRLFKGTNVGVDGEVISAYYDQQGSILSNNIPLEIVAVPNSPQNGVSVISLSGDLTTLQDMQNFSIKTVPSCYTTHNLGDGELITMVAYSDNGLVVSMQQFRIVNTSFIRNSELGIKYVTSISVESPFISNFEPGVIRYPLNVPIEGLSLIGVVTYSDGSELRLPVDGTKFSMWGFENFVSTIVGQEFPLVLKYKLANGEAVAGSTNVGHGEGITQSLRGIALNVDGAFTNKLYCYPVWVNEVTGYRLEWFMYTLERSAGVRVTQHVRINENTAGFNPTLYGVNQQLSVSITLRDVNGSLPNYVHTQMIGVTLIGSATADTTNWKVQFSPNQNPMYGNGIRANSAMVNSNLWKLRLDSGFTNFVDWLEALYYKTLPLTDTVKETRPPEPNFFKVVIGNVETELPISQWNAVQQFVSPIRDGTNVYLKFFRRVADNDVQLSIAALNVIQGPDEPSVIVTPPAALTVGLNTNSLTVTATGNGLASGNTLATVTGGVGPFTFSWARTSGNRSGVSNPGVANPTFLANITAGDNFQERWTLTVTDALNTVATNYVDVLFRVTLPLMANIVPNDSVAPISAPGVASKVLTVVVTNGNAPYSYLWSRTAGTRGTASSTSAIAPTISANLDAGDNVTETWSCVVTDGLGNQVTATTDLTFLVTNPLTVTISPEVVNETRAGSGAISKQLSTTVNEGYGPYTFQWNRISGSTTSLSSLTSPSPTVSTTLVQGTSVDETWRVVVTDAAGATALDSVNISFTATGALDPVVITYAPNPFVVNTADPTPVITYTPNPFVVNTVEP